MLQQRGFSNAGFTAHDQRPTPTIADVVDEAVQEGALGRPPEEGGAPTGSSEPALHIGPLILEPESQQVDLSGEGLSITASTRRAQEPVIPYT